MTQSRAIVIGGGIGGLTAAVALHRSGHQVTVLERAGSLSPVGAGISLAPNSLRALDVIGLGDDVRALAAWQGAGGIKRPDGRWLSRTDTTAAATRYGGPLVVVHRATLIDALAARLPAGTVRTAATATLADAGGPARPARVTASDEEYEADLVVAADGIRSAVRARLFPAHPGAAYAGFTTWRIVTALPGRAAGSFDPHETWGRGRIWGSQPLADGRVYAYAAARLPAGLHAPDDEKAELHRRFGDWHDPVPALIEAVGPDQVLRHDVHHLAVPLPAFHQGRVALIGDAAHAMPPTLGQGGNQAIEDAVVLAHHAAPGDRDLAAYTAARRPRTTAVARKAVAVARLNMLSARPAIAVRDTAVRVVGRLGPGLVLRSFDGIADWRPPQATYAAKTQHTA